MSLVCDRCGEDVEETEETLAVNPEDVLCEDCITELVEEYGQPEPEEDGDDKDLDNE